MRESSLTLRKTCHVPEKGSLGEAEVTGSQEAHAGTHAGTCRTQDPCSPSPPRTRRITRLDPVCPCAEARAGVDADPLWRVAGPLGTKPPPPVCLPPPTWSLGSRTPRCPAPASPGQVSKAPCGESGRCDCTSCAGRTRGRQLPLSPARSARPLPPTPRSGSWAVRVRLTLRPALLWFPALPAAAPGDLGL